MSVRVVIFDPHLRQLTGEQEVVELSGGSIGECLDLLVDRFPDVKKGLFNGEGQLHSYVYFSINGEVAYPADPAMPLKDGDELLIGLVVAGG